MFDKGPAALDLRMGLRTQFRTQGVTKIDADPRCTVEDPELYSHRRGPQYRSAGRADLAGGEMTGRLDFRELDAARLAELTASLGEGAAAHRVGLSAGRAHGGGYRVDRGHQDPAGRDVALLLDLGLRVFGENVPRRPRRSWNALSSCGRGWHRNGIWLAGSAEQGPRGGEVGGPGGESVDSSRLADALEVAARRAVDEGTRQGPLPVLVQVSLMATGARWSAA